MGPEPMGAVRSGSPKPGPDPKCEAMSWEELGRTAKSVENSIDGKLLTLGRLTSAALRAHRYEGPHGSGATGGRGAGGGQSSLEAAEKLAAEVEDELRRLAGLIEALAERMEAMGSGTGTHLHHLQRHRDIFAEYSREFRRTRVGGAKDSGGRFL